MDEPKEKSAPLSPQDTTTTMQIYDEMVTEHPILPQTSPKEVVDLIRSSLTLIKHLEEVGRQNLYDISLSPGVADSLAALWIFSGPGTYNKPFKNDRYQQHPWARYMDRARLNYGARIMRKIAEVKTGVEFSGGLGNIQQRKRSIRQSISENSPVIIYNGVEEENEGVREILRKDGIIIPQSRVYIPNQPIINTVDQIKGLQVDGDLFEGREVGLVSHAPHIARILHILGKYNPFPASTKFRVFPLPTPPNGVDEYAKKETRGIVYYSLVTGDAAVKPVPFSAAGS